ncbi:MAG TPA: DUF1269 domain-containing protein [Ktedonobacterales bacterium]|nr:DUF1269 domain-containing protein [Ktedonobacterales bacterium]
MTSADVPVELVVAAFVGEDGAGQALKDLKEAKKQGLVGIRDAAVIRRDEKNKLHITETGDMSGGKGAVIGGIVGAALGLIAPPTMLVTGAVGATIGGLAAKLRDSGFPDDRLREIGDALKPGTSALIAVIEHTWVAQIEQELTRYGAQVLTEAIKSDVAQQLEAGQGVAYSALETSDDIVVDRSAEVGEGAQRAATPAAGDGAAPEATRFTPPAEQPPSQPT